VYSNRSKCNLGEHLELFLTIGGALGSGPLAATTADTHAVDNVALLGLVTEAASLIGAAGARSAVDDVQLAELY